MIVYYGNQRMKLTLALVVFVLFLYPCEVFSQYLKGFVKNSSGVAVPYTSIYIEEEKKGVLTNNNGLFQINLPPGNYTFVYKQIGYKTEKQSISIQKDKACEVEITLTPYPFYEYQNTDRKIELTGNDILNKVARKAASYTSYNADAYIKGNLTLTRITELTNTVVKKIENVNVSELENKIIHQEINCAVKYTAPDSYKIQVNGYTGNIADAMNTRGAIGLLSESIFSDWFNGSISPLGRRVSSYYKFKYKGYYLEDDKVINKIEVVPRYDDYKLLNGDLYITDDGNITCAKLYRKFQGLETVNQITYQTIDGHPNFPITYQTDISINILGNKGNVTYLTSLKYNKINNGGEGKGVTIRGDERPKINDKIIFNKDAYTQDSTFWDSIRMFPVHTERLDILDRFRLKERIASKPWYGKAMLGDYFLGNDSSKWSLRYGGVKMIFRDYNYVDGFWLGNRFYLKSQIDKDQQLEISPYIYYTTARHRLIGGSDFTYNYLPERAGKLKFSIGSHTADFNSLSITRYNNYFSSLFLGKNYNSFYQKDYVSVNNDIDLTKKLKLTVGLGIERRAGLDNNTDFTIIKRDNITPNINPDKRFDRTYYSVGLSYVPFANYTIQNNESPLVFHLQYEEGFSSWQTNNSQYRKIKGGAVQNIRLNYFDKLDYKFEAGAFVGPRKNLHFADYQFYGAPDLVFNLGSLFDSFLLLDNYELQANHYWVTLSFNYASQYFLLKRLSFLQGKPFFEGLHFKTLYTPDIKFYSEIGYSINITRLFGMGVFSSFNNFDYKTAGVRFSLNLQSLLLLKD